MSTLVGKAALVTGGTRGIGFATAAALARAGATVTITGRSDKAIDEAIATLPGVRGVALDVTDRAGMAKLFEGGFDILVNNAGVIEPIGRAGDIAIEDFARLIEVNVTAAFHAIQLGLPAMLARGGGTIINLSSGAAHRALEGWSAYCASKAALKMITSSVHLEYGGKGIRAFGFAPGVVDTDMQGSIRASGINPVSQLPRAALAPADLPAAAIVFLCEAGADAYRGQEIDVRDAGFRAAAGLPA